MPTATPSMIQQGNRQAGVTKLRVSRERIQDLPDRLMRDPHCQEVDAGVGPFAHASLHDISVCLSADNFLDLNQS